MTNIANFYYYWNMIKNFIDPDDDDSDICFLLMERTSMYELYYLTSHYYRIKVHAVLLINRTKLRHRCSLRTIDLIVLLTVRQFNVV